MINGVRINNIYCDGKNLKKPTNLYEPMSAKLVGYIKNEGERTRKSFCRLILIYKTKGGREGWPISLTKWESEEERIKLLIL